MTRPSSSGLLEPPSTASSMSRCDPPCRRSSTASSSAPWNPRRAPPAARDADGNLTGYLDNGEPVLFGTCHASDPRWHGSALLQIASPLQARCKADARGLQGPRGAVAPTARARGFTAASDPLKAPKIMRFQCGFQAIHAQQAPQLAKSPSQGRFGVASQPPGMIVAGPAQSPVPQGFDALHPA